MHYNYDSFARTEMDGKFIKRVIITTRFVRKEDVFESEFKKRRNNILEYNQNGITTILTRLVRIICQRLSVDIEIITFAHFPSRINGISISKNLFCANGN